MSLLLDSALAYGSAALEAVGARLVDYTESDVSVETGLGGQKRRLDAPLGALSDWLDHNVEDSRRGSVSFFRGIAAVLLAPRLTRRESTMPFPEAAAKIRPSLEGPLFAAGALAAGSATPFGGSPFGDFFVAHFVDHDRGSVLIDEQKRATWQVSVEHLEKAALSLVYHQTYDHEPIALAGVPEATYFAFGDGADAARSLLLNDLFYGRCRKGLLFGVPCAGQVCLLDREYEAIHRDAFAAHVRESFVNAAAPLSDRLFLNLGGVITALPGSSAA